MLTFCLRSFFTEYGWQFLWRVALPHPIRTAKATIRSLLLDCSGDVVALSKTDTDQTFRGPSSIIGVGFCLKPMNPPCPSDRFNHDCLYLEKLLPSGTAEMPESCRQCAIREIGGMAANAGCSLYIMTSAKDILFDVYLPALRRRRFTEGLFVLCRYSLRPFTVGLLASGMRGAMVTFAQGDCADYRTWLRADQGIKGDRTSIRACGHEAIANLLPPVSNEPTRFQREDHVFHPEKL